MLANQKLPYMQTSLPSMDQKNDHRLSMWRLASDRRASTAGDCSGRERGFCSAVSGDCLPVTRRRFGGTVPECDVANVDAPELLLLGETASVTRASDFALFFNLEA